MDRIYLPFYRSFMIKDKGESICSAPTAVSRWPLMRHAELLMPEIYRHCRFGRRSAGLLGICNTRVGADTCAFV